MTRITTQGQERLAADIRRQIGERSTTRFLGAMPTYTVVSDIPEHLRRLLDQLEAAEKLPAGRSRP